MPASHTPVVPECAIFCFGVALIEKIRALLNDSGFLVRHRMSEVDFTRMRKLTFVMVNLILIRKSLKSVTRRLHEVWGRLGFLDCGADTAPPTASAWSQARAKLSPGALVELNQEVVLKEFYAQPGAVKRWRGHRLLACDGSELRLPVSEKLAEKFGVVRTEDRHGKLVEFSQARISVFYDVLNALVLDAQMGPYKEPEIKLMEPHLKHLQKGDLSLWDRGYPSLEFFARISATGTDFVARCSRNTFAAARALFKEGRGGVSRRVTLKAEGLQRAELVALGLPVEVTVRFVSVKLNTGEIEVLATSLLDEEAYPCDIFGALYHKRWGVETFYHGLKSHLDLENFSGESVHAVEQDFQAMILVSNLESVLTRPAQQQLSAGDAKRENPAVVNHTVSLHAIKDHVLELFYTGLPAAEILARLTGLFTAAPVCERPGRKVPRAPVGPRRSLAYQRYQKKAVF